MRFPIITGALAISLIASGLAFASTRTSEAARPDLVVSSISNPPEVTFEGRVFAVTDRTRNIGGATARSTVTQYYLSSNGNRTAVGRRFVVRLRSQRSSRGLSHVKVLDSVAPGIYSLVACADGRGAVRESNERNNCRTAATTVVVKKPPPPV
jgi:subtilase family serine protease